MNNLQPNPAHAEAATFVQPDWNSAYGDGVAKPTPIVTNYQTLYEAAVTGEKARQA